MVAAVADVFLRDIQSQLGAGVEKAGHADPGDHRVLAENHGNLPVTLTVDVLQKGTHTADVIGLDAAAVIEVVIQGYHRHTAADQLLGNGRGIVGHQNRHTVAVAEANMADIIAAPGTGLVTDEGNVVVQFFRPVLEAVQHMGEVLMGQSAVGTVAEDHADVVGSAGFQVPGGGTGGIAHLGSGSLNTHCGLGADIRGSVKGFTDRGNGHAALLRQHL